MTTFPGTYVPTGLGSSERVISVIDELLSPRLLAFRQIEMNDIPATLLPDKTTWRTDFPNLLEGFPIEFRRNGEILGIDSVDDIDYALGTFQIGTPEVGADGRPRDTMEVSYQFDYFPYSVLEGYIKHALMTVNTGAVGSITGYAYSGSTLPPLQWDGVVADIAFAMCMEKLLLDYDLWKYRLVFAISPTDNDGMGSNDIVQQLETLKRNAEERAQKTLENPKFKSGNYVSPPTMAYYSSIRMNGRNMGAHGIPFVSGRLRGWRSNQVWAQ